MKRVHIAICLIFSFAVIPAFAQSSTSIIPPSQFTESDRTHSITSQVSFQFTSSGDPLGNIWSVSSENCAVNSENIDDTGLFQWIPTSSDLGKRCSVVVILYAQGGNFAVRNFDLIIDENVPELALIDEYSKMVFENRTIPSLSTVVRHSSSDQSQSTYTITSGNLSQSIIDSLNPRTGEFSASFPFDTTNIEQGRKKFEFIWSYENGNVMYEDITSSIQVRNVNRPPVIEPIPDAVTRTPSVDEHVSFDLKGSDPDGDVSLWSMTPFVEGATLNAETGAFTFTPRLEHVNASITIDFVLTDSGSLSETVSHTFEVSSNVLPTFDVYSQTVSENATMPALFTVVTNPLEDPPDHVSIYRIKSGNLTDAMTDSLNFTTGRFLAPVPFNTVSSLQNSLTFAFGWTFEDGTGESDKQSGTITVNHTNRIPVIDPIPDTVPATELSVNKPVSFDLKGSDPDEDVILWSIASFVDGAKIAAETGEFTFTPIPEHGSTSITFEFLLTDITGAQSLPLVHVFDIAKFDALSILAGDGMPLDFPSGQSTEYVMAVPDVDPDNLDWEILRILQSGDAVENPGVGISNDGQLTWNPPHSLIGQSYEVEVRVTDRTDEMTGMATLDVAVVDDIKPVISFVTLLITDNSTGTSADFVQVTDNDQSQEPDVACTREGGTSIANGHLLSVGSTFVTCTATDPSLNEAVLSGTIIVGVSTNMPPTFDAYVQTVQEGQSLPSLSTVVTNPPEDPPDIVSDYTIVSGNLTQDIIDSLYANNGTFRGTIPFDTVTGTPSSAVFVFGWTYQDGSGVSDEQTATITVNIDNRAPVMDPPTSLPSEILVNQRIAHTFTGSDPDGDAVRWSLANPVVGAFLADDGYFTFTSRPAYGNTSVTVEIILTDIHGAETSLVHVFNVGDIEVIYIFDSNLPFVFTSGQPKEYLMLDDRTPDPDDLSWNIRHVHQDSSRVENPGMMLSDGGQLTWNPPHSLIDESYEVTLGFTSKSSNRTGHDSIRIHVVDKTSPVISFATVLTADSSTGTRADFVQVTDNHPTQEPDVVCIMAGGTVITNGDLLSVGSHIIACTATDADLNQMARVGTVLVDYVAPMLVLPPDVVIEATGTLTSVNIGNATVANDTDSTITNDAPAFFPLGDTSVTWMARDSFENMVTGIQTVTVQDTTAPTITVPIDITAEATGQLTSLDIGSPTASDIVDTDVVIINDAPDSFPVGITLITYTATDDFDNFVTAIQKVTIQDTTNPVLVLPPDVMAEATGVMSDVDIGTATVANDTDSTITNDAPDSFPLGETIVTWTARDGADNTVTAIQKVTVRDTTAPTITLPDDVTAEAIGALTSVDIGSPTASDIADTDVAITHDAPASFPVGITEVTWTATDDSDNFVTDTQKIIIQDTVDPVLVLPPDVVIEATGIQTSVNIGNAAVTDNLGLVNATHDAPDSFPLGETMVTWTARDGAENTVTAIQRIIVRDTTNPTITVPIDITAEATGQLTSLDIGSPTASDIVDTDVAITHDAPDSFPVGITEVTWTATDDSDNFVTAIQKVTIRDTTNPVLVLPPDVMAEATGVMSDVDIGTATVANDTDSTITNDAPDSFPLGETMVTWTARDGADNTVTAIQKVTVRDTTAPTITVPIDITAEATGQLTSLDIVSPTASDIVDPDVAITHDAPDSFPVGTTIVTCIATDDSGNFATATLRVTIQDTTDPVIILPPDVVIEATGIQTSVDIGTVIVADNLGLVNATHDAPDSFPLGETMVTWTARDGAENTVTATQRIIVRDTTNPTITVPDSIVAEATGQLSDVDIGSPTARDIVDSDVIIINDAPDLFPIDTLIVTYTATDDSGNSATAIQRVTIQDTTKPVIVAPDDISLEVTGLLSMIQLGTATATDTVDATPVITNDAPTSFLAGTTTVTWTATDDSDNFATDTQKIIIQDTTDPVLVLPLDIIIEASGIQTSVNIGTATVTDNAGSITATNDAPDSFPLGETMVTWTARDGADNTVTAIQKVTVRDTTDPIIAVSHNIIAEATGQLTSLDIGSPSARDIVDSDVAITHDAPDSFPVGMTLITYTATDDSGNFVTTTQRVTIRDTTNPILDLPPDVTTEATGVQTSVDIGTATVTDNVDLINATNNAPNSFPLGETMVTWTARDGAENTVTAIQRVTVRDTTAPTITVPIDITAEATGQLTSLDIGSPTASDIVDPDVTITHDAPDSFPVGTTIVTCIATDDSGNSVTATQRVIIRDTTKPVIVAPDDISLDVAGLLSMIQLGTATATDTVDATPVITNDAPTSFLAGTTTVTWTATDDSDNFATDTQKIIIQDTTNPVLVLPSDITIEATGIQTSVNIGTATVTDNADSITATNDAPDSFPLGETIVTWTARDGAENTVTAIQRVTVRDTTDPIIAVPNNIIAEATGQLTSLDIGSPSARDIVDTDVAITHDAPDSFPVGMTLITYTATDDSGNFVTATQKVTIRDTTNPILDLPPDVTTEATGVQTSVDIGTATVTDNVDSINATNNAPDSFPLGETIVTWTARDSLGNTASATQSIMIQDTTNPVFVNFPDDVMVFSAERIPVEFENSTATDIFSVTVLCNYYSGESFPVGSTSVTCIATDANRNSVQDTFTVTVTPPEFESITDTFENTNQWNFIKFKRDENFNAVDNYRHRIGNYFTPFLPSLHIFGEGSNLNVGITRNISLENYSSDDPLYISIDYRTTITSLSRGDNDIYLEIKDQSGNTLYKNNVYMGLLNDSKWRTFTADISEHLFRQDDITVQLYFADPTYRFSNRALDIDNFYLGTDPPPAFNFGNFDFYYFYLGINPPPP